MGLSNNKLILIFGFNEEEQKELNQIITAKGLPVFKVIHANMAEMKIKNIIEGMKISTKNTIKENEKVILFNNLEDDELEKSITIFREKFKNVIFAVTTPTSAEWTFKKLLSNLIEEKKWADSRVKN